MTAEKVNAQESPVVKLAFPNQTVLIQISALSLSDCRPLGMIV
jgi:hypothetical protein